MVTRRYPGRPTPFLEQKSPRARQGRGFGIGAAIFLILLLGLIYVGLVVIPPLIEDAVFPDIGISYSTLFFIFLGCFILVSIGIIFRNGLFGANRIGYGIHDPSICKRVIKDGYDGIEVIVSGGKAVTFAQACRANWQFKNVNQNSNWYIKDEKGNDVTNSFLETADGVFFLIPEYDSEMPKEEPDESDEYSSIHDGVTYYD